MADIMKKAQRKADSYLAGSAEAHHGKRANQKIKPYVVLQYLLKYSDEDHPQTAYDIIGFLEEHGIEAERRSIYTDIREINKVALMLEADCSIDEAHEMLEDDDSQKLVIYDPHRKGFYVNQRHFDLNDMRLLAECVYAAKFVSEGQAKRLVDVVCDFVSEEQAERIRHNVFLADRVKTNNKSVLFNISTINAAMSRKLDGQPHKPEKISFKYLHYTIDDVGQQVERRKGDRYIVSPFHLMINDGNYYLIAFDDRKKQMRNYRIDRMKDVALAGEAREGDEQFAKMDLKSYSQRVFSMYGGKVKLVTIRFTAQLLDTAIERFGTKNVRYAKVDDNHFTVTATVEISDQFWGWLLGFGKRAKLLSPDDAVEQFAGYLDKVRSMY